MSYKSITFQTICGAIYHQLKIILLTILIFALAGAGVGYWYASSTEVVSAGRADVLEPVDFSKIPRSSTLYKSYWEYIGISYNNTVSYLNTVLQNASSPEQSQELQALLKRLQEFDNTSLVLIKNSMRPRNTLFIPDDFLDAAIGRYEVALENIRLDLIEAESARELLKTMDAPNVENDTYNQLLTLAADYGNKKMVEQEYISILEQLRNDPEQIRTQSRHLENEFMKAGEQLTAFGEELSLLANEVAERDAIVFSLKYLGDHTAEVNVTHTHAAASAKENFMILFLFCTLVGICCGLFFAVCREARIVSAAAPVSEPSTKSKTGETVVSPEQKSEQL